MFKPAALIKETYPNLRFLDPEFRLRILTSLRLNLARSLAVFFRFLGFAFFGMTSVIVDWLTGVKIGSSCIVAAKG